MAGYTELKHTVQTVISAFQILRDHPGPFWRSGSSVSGTGHTGVRIRQMDPTLQLGDPALSLSSYPVILGHEFPPLDACFSICKRKTEVLDMSRSVMLANDHIYYTLVL